MIKAYLIILGKATINFVNLAYVTREISHGRSHTVSETRHGCSSNNKEKT